VAGGLKFCLEMTALNLRGNAEGGGEFRGGGDDVADNLIGPEGASALAEGLKSCSKMTALNLSCEVAGRLMFSCWGGGGRVEVNVTSQGTAFRMKGRLRWRGR
jgi:hypothetical protein